MTDHWVHDLSPFLIKFWGNFGVRYYGLSYALAFLIGYWLLTLYRKKGRLNIKDGDEITLIIVLVLGTMLGGRLGYMLLYDFHDFIRAPWIIVKVWQGGMSSHGGFIGVALAALYLSKKFKTGMGRLSDVLATLAPPGLFLGRIANFINGELWGKVSDVSWAVIFPSSAPSWMPVAQIPARHPSQLYEAGLEGLVLVIYTQLRFWKSNISKEHPGQLAAEFLFLYGVLRIFVEQFREPDASLILGLNRGIFYSVFMIITAIIVFYKARQVKHKD